MSDGIANAVLVLLGAIVGGAAVVVGSIVTSRAASSSELRRAATEAAIREWERLADFAEARRAQGRRARLYPLALFVFFNVELLKLVDADQLTVESYKDLAARRDRFRQVLEVDGARRTQELREEDGE